MRPNQLTTKTAGDRIKTATKRMKKMLLVLIALMGISFAAKAQSCDVGQNTYVAVDASVNNGKIVCSGYCYGDAIPASGTVYATVYYVDKKGNEGSEMITIRWDYVYNNQLVHNPNSTEWKGNQTNIARITKWEVSAGACRIERK